MNYIVRIPEPCHEDWNQMKPDEKGRYCNVCSKSVYDFSNKTDDYIHSVLKKSVEENVQVCGHFRKSQIDRPMQLAIPFQTVVRSVSRANVFAVALFFVFGTFLFSCTNDDGKKFGEIGISRDEKVMGDLSFNLPSEEKADSAEEVVECTSEIQGDIAVDYIPMVEGGISYQEIEAPPPLIPDTPIVVDPLPEVFVEGAVAYRPGEWPEVEGDIVKNTDTLQNQRLAPPAAKEFKLNVYPNPNTGEFNLSYELKNRGLVQADIYDMEGHLVRSLIKQQTQHTGRYVLPVNLNELASGIYICKLIIDGSAQHEEIVITK